MLRPCYPFRMRIAYINHGRFPTEKAHGYQTAQVCDAMMELGHEVTLLTPSIQTPITQSPRMYYGLRHDLTVVSLKADVKAPGFLRFLFMMRVYGKEVTKYLEASPADLLYIRSPYLLAAALRTQIPVIIELHTVPGFFFLFKGKLNRCKKVVCLTSQMRDAVVRAGVDASHVVVEGDAVDLKKFSALPDKGEMKAKWGLPTEKKVIGYVGSLVTRETLEKGVRELIDAIARPAAATEPVPSRAEGASPLHTKLLLWIVGGPEKWVNEYKRHAESLGLKADCIRFESHIEAQFVPNAIAACDICVYPAPKSDNPYFTRDTSPLKLF
ncbi:hypothetical protein EXS70_04940, partial [Candidatus Peribacteria bacterium]|nr:hypothetical protein [Candidatus Peribacteria bacterium]